MSTATCPKCGTCFPAASPGTHACPKCGAACPAVAPAASPPAPGDDGIEEAEAVEPTDTPAAAPAPVVPPAPAPAPPRAAVDGGIALAPVAKPPAAAAPPKSAEVAASDEIKLVPKAPAAEPSSPRASLPLPGGVQIPRALRPDTRTRLAPVGPYPAPPVAAGPSLVREAVMIAVGALGLVAGIVVLARGPFGEPEREALGAQKADAEAHVRSIEGQLALVEARAQEIRELVPRAKLDTAEQQRRALVLKGRKTALDRIDAEVARLVAESEREKGTGTGEGPGAAGLPAAEKAVVIIKTDRGSGSGFVVDPKGSVITNYHVVEGSSTLEVRIQERGSSKTVALEGARIGGVDADGDLALISLPAAPAAVSGDGTYPALALRTTPMLQLGENVFALGNPGSGHGILEYTLTQGIVSSASRQIDTRTVVQTTAPANPGNSGGPLLDARGQAVGVVVAKGVGVEAVTFAVPASHVWTFMRSWTQEPFAVATTLEAWETVHRPLTALARRHPSYRDECAVAVAEAIDRILLSPDGTKLYLLMGEAGRVAEFDIASRATTREFKADCALGWMELDERGSLYVLAAEKDSLLRIDADTMRLRDETVLPARPREVAHVGGAGGFVAVTLDGAAPVLLAYHDFGRKGAFTELGDDHLAAICASDGQWLCMARRTAHEGSGGSVVYELIAYRAGALQAAKSLAAAREEAKRQGFQPPLVRRISGFQRQIADARSVYTLSGQVARAEGGPPPAIHFLRNDRVVFGRRVIALGATLKVECTLAPGPYSTDDRPEMERHRDFYQYMDNVFSVSPDGKWAATGTHLYSLQSLKPVSQLPFPATVHAFSRDARTMYLYDGIRRKLYVLETGL